MAVSAGFGFIALSLMLLLALLYLTEHVLFALAAYHDAQAQGNPDALIWGLAIGFLGLIPGIVYLCVRGSGRRMVRCANCGYPHDVSDFCCPKCGEKNPAAAQANPYEQALASRAKKEMIGGIAVIAAGILLTILVMMFFSFSISMGHRLFF
ncbi:hypothetical protein EQM14_16045 [Caproiciproducens sp. NJN-50]|uniref:hypothetical protein n=1 Tax=Acutalibacteraceae TaxID=3082771 RepID=UPI000FFE1AE1|nr:MULTISPECIES: hypothetical protein [Acutalibacteraceae]QAT51160.1 hypothetical protein EQM14_16045 [Caproiciproducens sp. NJN-50]